MRIGELLIEGGILRAEHVEQVLVTQASSGGRFASVATLLGLADGDAVSRVLGHQLGVPAALTKHFATIDPRATGRFTRKMANAYRALPLGFSTKHARTLIVAFVDPHQLTVIDEIQFLVGARVLATVGLESRIERALERLYGVSSRNVPAYQRDEYPLERPDDLELVIQRTSRPLELPARPPSSELPRHRPSSPALDMPAAPMSSAPMSIPPLSSTPMGSEPPAQASERHALADTAPSIPSALHSSLPEPSEPPPHSMTRSSRPTLARESRAPENKADPRVDPDSGALPRKTTPPPLAAHEVLELLERAQTRDDVGDALLAFLRHSFGCGAVLITRNDVAVGWRAFRPVGAHKSTPPTASASAYDVETLALPLSTPSIFSAAYETGRTVRGPLPAGDNVPHQRVLRALQTTAPQEAVVTPIVAFGAIQNLVYAQAPDGRAIPDALVSSLEATCAAAAKAYARIR